VYKSLQDTMAELPTSYGASSALCDHTCHSTQVNVLCHNSSQVGRYSTYLPQKN